MNYITTVGERTYAIEINDENHVTLDGAVIEVDWHPLPGQPVFTVLIDGQSYEAYLLPTEGGYQVQMRGMMYEVRVEDERELRLRAAVEDTLPASSEYQLRAPMPGLVAAVPVSEGESVEKGSVLIVLESMKMQNELKSPRPGRVAHLRVSAGQTVEQDQTLLIIE
jgi:biotin carboxyl carrier protein